MCDDYRVWCCPLSPARTGTESPGVTPPAAMRLALSVSADPYARTAASARMFASGVSGRIEQAAASGSRP